MNFLSLGVEPPLRKPICSKPLTSEQLAAQAAIWSRWTNYGHVPTFEEVEVDLSDNDYTQSCRIFPRIGG